MLTADDVQAIEKVWALSKELGLIDILGRTAK